MGNGPYTPSSFTARVTTGGEDSIERIVSEHVTVVFDQGSANSKNFADEIAAHYTQQNGRPTAIGNVCEINEQASAGGKKIVQYSFVNMGVLEPEDTIAGARKQVHEESTMPIVRIAEKHNALSCTHGFNTSQALQ